LSKKVYIILLNYNGWKDTIECLESVLKNDYPNYQVIVVDNDSPNNSMEYIINWAEGKQEVVYDENSKLKYLSQPFEKKPLNYVYYTKKEALRGGNKEKESKLNNPLIFIQAGENGGFAAGNNVGIKYALAKDDFDSVILLNNDTVIGKDTIRNLVEQRMKLGEKAIYGGKIYYYSNPKKIWYDGGHFNEWLGRSTHINMGKIEDNIGNNESIKKVNFITFCYVLIPKFILKKIGLLDESYFMYVEDLDYSYKVWKNGYKLYHVPTSKVWHKVGASSGEDEVSEFVAYWGMRNRVRFILKENNFLKKFSALWFILLTRLVRFPKYWLIGYKHIIIAQLKGIKDAIK
jgi:GT2 family glycosyltransferase